MTTKTQVIIIGAGPTGMIAAATLAKANVNVRIFEKSLSIAPISRAVVIHAGTLECLEKSHPLLLEKILAKGLKLNHANVGLDENKRIDLSLIPSKYNFVLSLAQNETEKILENYLESLNIKIERGCELINLEQKNNQVTAFIKQKDEFLEIKSDYLLDCGGAHSASRHLLNISFTGEKYLGHIIMGDVKIKAPFALDGLRIINNKNGLSGILPLENGLVRLILMPSKNIEINNIDINYFKNLAQQQASMIEIIDHNWLSAFQTHKRIANKFRVDNIFLVGDAAHIHSPVGGQGMNMGIHDALNISHKLIKVLKNNADKKLLTFYETERRKVIKKILRYTDKAMKSGLDSRLSSILVGPIVKFIIAPIFFRSKFLQKQFGILISQIKSARKEISRY